MTVQGVAVLMAEYKVSITSYNLVVDMLISTGID